MLIRDAEIAGRRCDLRIEGFAIAELGARLERHPGECVLEADGGALLPGLHDHHLHLRAMAAALDSVPCGPPDVSDATGLARALARAARERPSIRAVGYHESVAGPLDRARLDALCPDRPLRVQHRSGVMWFLNSAALKALELAPGELPAGAECDAEGRPNGRFFRLDDWLRERRKDASVPDLAPVGVRLARLGVVGVSDASPDNGPEEQRAFADAQARGALPQRLWLMGRIELDPRTATDRLGIGPHKILFDEARLPPIESLVSRIEAAHAVDRGVAIHCVTRGEILVALAALEEAGARPGDRLEHASVCPPEAFAQARSLDLTVVTQPGFVAERGDTYLDAVDPTDRDHLYRVGSWHRAGARVAAGSDAPYGDWDPWLGMRAATQRETRSGRRLGTHEAIAPEAALALYSSPLDAPGRVRAPLRAGQAADLVLLDAPWHAARRTLCADSVRATWIAGELVWSAAGA